MKNIDPFIDRLSRGPKFPNAFNPFARGNPHNAIRRQNLRLYFQEIQRYRPTLLLVAEAPGYQGSRLTGVPFMSEDMILRGIPELGMFGQDKGYRKTTEFERVFKEPSATIVWSTLAAEQFVPLLWSSFPYHPHKPGQPLTNRAPKPAELEYGKTVFQDLMKIFGISEVVAVGNVAHQSLADVGIVTEKIRHPSHGGKNDFVRGIKQIKRQRS